MSEIVHEPAAKKAQRDPGLPQAGVIVVSPQLQARFDSLDLRMIKYIGSKY